MVSPRTVAAYVTFALLAASAHELISAAEHTGQVTFAGAPVPGATVVAVQGDRRVETTSNEDGAYRFADLEEGAWTLHVEMRGFAPASRDVTVTTEQAATQTWELALLSFEEIARGGTETAQLPSADPSSAANPAVALAVPPGGDPSATASRAQTSAGRAANTPGAAQPAATSAEGTLLPEEAPANALFGAVDSFLVNGSVMNAAATPFAQSRALGNVAQRQLGTRLPYRITTSIGGRSSALDARPAGFATRPDNYNLNFSATVGGPLRIPGIVSNGPQFTFTVSRSDAYTAQSSALFVPTARERAGDFSQSVDAFGRPVQVIDPVTGLPFADNVIPPDRISPAAAALLAYYPPATGDAGSGSNYHGPAIADGHTDSLSFRLGSIALGRQTFIDNLSVGYSRGTSQTTTPFRFEDGGRSSGVTASAGVTQRISPFMVVRVRNSVSQGTSRAEPYFANRVNVSALAGITGNNQDPENWGPPTLTFRTIAPLATADSALDRRLTNLTVAESGWSYRRHYLSFGGEVGRRHTDLVSQQNPRGAFFFSGDETGADFADFLLGLPRSSTIAFGNADKYFRQTSYAAFLTDDWRIGSSLTVNLGVRWEYETPVTEARERLVNLDVAPGFDAVSPVIADDPVGALTGQPYGTSLVRPDRRGIQPRVAIAWRPILGSSVIVRAGYGIYRNTNVYEPIALRMAQQPPLSYGVSAERSDATPITLADGFIASPGITQIPWAVDPGFRVGFAHNWQAMIQRDFPFALQVAATYVGVRGVHLPQVLLPNTVAPGAVPPCASCPTGFQYLTSDGTSRAHRGQLQVRRRLRSGIEASVQYTIATGDDNATTFVGIGGTPAQNWLDLDAERGPSAAIRRHEVGGQVTYSSTVGAGRRGWLPRLLGGWVVSGQFSAGSGYPLTPVYRTTIPGTIATGAVRPSLTGAPLDAIPDGYYLNPAAFAAPAPGAWGNAPRGSVWGPGTFTLDGRIQRAFQVNGRMSMTWGLSVSNLLNHVDDTGVNTSVGSPQFGLPTGVTPSRRIDLQLQMSFR